MKAIELLIPVISLEVISQVCVGAGLHRNLANASIIVTHGVTGRKSKGAEEGDP